MKKLSLLFWWAFFKFVIYYVSVGIFALYGWCAEIFNNYVTLNLIIMDFCSRRWFFIGNIGFLGNCEFLKLMSCKMGNWIFPFWLRNVLSLNDFIIFSRLLEIAFNCFHVMFFKSQTFLLYFQRFHFHFS